MLTFHYREESANGEMILRPRLAMCINGDILSASGSALLDSGADRSIIPSYVAEVIGLEKGKPIETSGVGGNTAGYESTIEVTLFDKDGKTQEIAKLPVYVLYNFHEVVIGRKAMFNRFRITFEEFNNKIVLEEIPKDKTYGTVASS